MYHFYSQILKNLGSFHFSLFDFELFRLRSKKKKVIDWVLAKFKWRWFWIKSKYIEFDMFDFWQKFQSLGYCQPSLLLYFSRLLHKFFNLPVCWFLFNQYRWSKSLLFSFNFGVCYLMFLFRLQTDIFYNSWKMSCKY